MLIYTVLMQTGALMRTRARHIWLLLLLSVGCLAMTATGMYRQGRVSPQIRMLTQMAQH